MHATVSLGVACYHPGDTIAELIERADGAMYAAKHAGRNRVRVDAPKLYDEELQAPEPS